MGLLMGCGTWALWHAAPSQKISDFLLKNKTFWWISSQRFGGGALAVNLF
jgi:hypothetical protein